ncbi:MAG: acylneuraminate cytidylyltransferase family protein [Candidatus Marinimicrobia bacterium]|nr:acylneuraminate cytidylyltransferase family protein [Candidatus Neomarinimicrobiota bacterium]MCF7904359.1 acylneuraminate cytidylyltransferase family protein [Candidatus Neomarinimicrobiota bacterium]
MEIYCIIPARGGSKGVPRKNVLPFLGQPLITHSIQYAKSSDLVTRVFVSTDDEEISTISTDAGADIITRPAEISGDTATTEAAIEHALSWWQEHELRPDIIVLLQATSPVRPNGSLDEALKKFQAQGNDSMLSLSPTHRFFWTLNGNRASAGYDYLNRPRRQDMVNSDIRYVENGSVYIFTRDHFQSTGNRLGGDIGYIVFPEEYGIEIDTEADFTLLETIHK